MTEILFEDLVRITRWNKDLEDKVISYNLISSKDLDKIKVRK